MNASTKRILVIIIAIAIIIPTVYLAYAIYLKGAAQQDPVSYVPSNSSFVAKYHSQNGTTYFFFSNGSYGLVTTTSIGGFMPVANNTTISGFSNLSLNFSIVEVYHGVQIFELSNISVNESILAAMGRSLGVNESILALLPLVPSFNITNVSIYLANPATGVLAVGNLNGVENSIYAHESGQTFMSKSMIHFNSTSNVSFYYTPQNTSLIMHISGNITDNSTHIFIKVSNQTSVQKMMLLLQLQNLSGLAIKYYSNSFFELSFNVGYSSLAPILERMIGAVSNLTAPNGVGL